MKRGILYSSLVALALMSGVAIVLPQGEREYYEPRKNEAKEGIKGALEYYHMLRANPATGKISEADVLRARREVLEMASSRTKKSALDLDWEEVGPDNVGGRTRAFLIDKDNPNIMYAGGVAGGLFRSTNAGNSWTEVSNPMSNLAVTCIAQASDGTIYYGTGEGMYIGGTGNGTLATPGFMGGGVYKSTDGGQTFSVLPTTEPNLNDPGSDWSFIGKIEVDPNDPDRVYVAANHGLRVSSDGGQTWTNPISGLGQNGPAADMTVSASGHVWVKTNRYVYKSEDGGNTFEHITSNSNLPQNGARMRIAVSPQDDNYVYVISIDGDRFGTAYQSTNGGDSWTEIGERTSFLNPHNDQGNYNNALTVDPNNKERIIVGGVELWEWSEQGGWQQLANSNLPETNPFYVHADNHNVVFSKTDPNTFYVVNDGGVFRTKNNGMSFTSLNNNYSTMQFYHIGVGPNGIVMGGSQDNGTDIIDPNTTFPKRSRSVLGGDGGYSQLSRLHPGVLIGESQRGNTSRSTDNGETWDPYLDLDRMDPSGFYATDQWGAWITPFQLWEKLNDPLSEDSVTYGTDSIEFSLGFGNGNLAFTGRVPMPNDHEVLKIEIDTVIDPVSMDTSYVRDTILDTAIFVPTGFEINAESQSVIADTVIEPDSVLLRGDGTGYFNPLNGEFRVDFNNQVIVEIRAKAAVSYKAGSLIRLESATNELPLFDSLETDIPPNQIVRIQDPIQSMFFLGLRTHRVSKSTNGKYTRNHYGGIWMTREILSSLERTPQWIHIGVLADNEAPTCMDVSEDGDILFVGTDQGRVYRFSNLANARDSASADIDSLYQSNNFIRASTSVVEKKIMSINSNNQVVTSLSVHPFDRSRVIATLGTYNRSTHVFLNTSADAANPPIFKSVQGDLPEMPVYSSTFNFTGSPGQAMIGTELGVFTTDNIDATNVTWEQEVNQFATVPVFTLVQDRTVRFDLKDTSDYEGTVYAGTHARGIWKTTSTANFVTIGKEEHEVEEEEDVDKQTLSIYPNPASDVVNIELALESRSDVEISIRDMNGKLVKQVRYDMLSRDTESVEVRVGSLPNGAYVVSMNAENKVTTGKIIKR